MPAHRLEPELVGDRGPRSRYREFAPPAALARTLVCSWVQVVGDGTNDYPQRVLPDGCVDLVCIGHAAPIAVGPATRTTVTPLPSGSTIVGIRFRPGLAPHALGVPASELLDRDVVLRDLWGEAADLLQERVAAGSSIQARLAALEQALLAHSARGARVDPLAIAAVAWLARRPTARVEALARDLGIASRQLHRRFVAAVGYGPKTFQRIARFQRLLAIAKRPDGDRPGLSQLALAAGYADQAHMTREVRALAGRTPGSMLGNVQGALVMSDLFETAH